MQLVVFDVDGTLTETVHADADCFERSLSCVCGFSAVETDWSRYRHATDPGILREIYEVRLGRLPTADEVSLFRQKFVELLRQASWDSPFSPVPGAPQLLSLLARSAAHRIALATGAWSDSARLKLLSAGMGYDEYVAASADDAFDREVIIHQAIKRAIERYGAFKSCVYIGDGIWDARACRSLRMAFIGVATGERASRLRGEGAVLVVPDFADVGSFLRQLDVIAASGRNPCLAPFTDRP